MKFSIACIFRIIAAAVALAILSTVSGIAQTNLTSMVILDRATACRIALDNQPTLRAALHRISQAKARVRQVQSRYWPGLAVSAGVSRMDQADSSQSFSSTQNTVSPLSQSPSGSTYSPTYSLDDPETYYQAGAQATWVLFDGFSRRATVSAVRFSENEVTEARREAQRQILSSVTAAFLNAQSAREQMTIAEEDAAFNERLLKDAISNRKAGKGSLSDELNFRVRANAAQSTVIFAHRQLQIARIGLATLMGIPDGKLSKILKLAPLAPVQPDETVIPDATNACTILITERPDILQAQAAINRSSASLRAAKSHYYPWVALTGSLDSRRAGDMDFSSDDFQLFRRCAAFLRFI